MAQNIKYFKLIGGKEWFYKITSSVSRNTGIPNGIVCLYSYSSKVEIPGTASDIEHLINRFMKEYNLKYVELNENEVKLLKLLYENKMED